MPIIQIGTPYRFVPSAFMGEKEGAVKGQHKLPRAVTGHISYINAAHRYFTVSFEVNGYHLHESFKF